MAELEIPSALDAIDEINHELGRVLSDEEVQIAPQAGQLLLGQLLLGCHFPSEDGEVVEAGGWFARGRALESVLKEISL